jgi:hypothetical protein
MLVFFFLFLLTKNGTCFSRTQIGKFTKTREQIMLNFSLLIEAYKWAKMSPVSFVFFGLLTVGIRNCVISCCFEI